MSFIDHLKQRGAPVRVLFLGLLLIAGACQASSGLIEPPFVRKWSVLTGDDTAILRVTADTIYFYSANGVGALDRETGRERWHALRGIPISSGLERASKFWLVQERDNDSQLIALDASSGSVEFRVGFGRVNPKVAADSRSIYVLEDAATVTALDPGTGNRRWSTPLTASPRRQVGSLTLLATGSIVYAGVGGLGRVALDPEDGRILWRQSYARAGSYSATAVEGDVLVRAGPPNGGLSRLEAATGKKVWSWPRWYAEATPFGDTLVGKDAKGPLAIGQREGELRWRIAVPGEQGGYWGLDEPDRVVTSDEVWIRWKPFLSVDRTGKVRWSREEPFTGNDVYADSKALITSDLERIFCYGRGTLPPLPESPSAREALAKARISEWEFLDDAERKQVEQLKPYVFRPLLARYLEWYRQDREADFDGPFGSTYFSLLGDTPDTLAAVFEKEDTAALVQALKKLGQIPYNREPLEAILREKGDPNVYIEELIAELGRTPKGERNGGPTLDTVVRSSHPAAVAFMLDAIRDLKGSLTWKIEAFRHLAGTGSEEGLAAVRALAPKRAPLTRWYDRVKVTDPHEAKPSVRRDAKGRTWAMFQSAVLGNAGDVFIAQRTDKGWGPPLFTGYQPTDNPRDRSLVSRRKAPPDRLMRGEWVRRFPTDAALGRDLDDDGWTDLVEARLGTDRKRPDTDGDGLKDSIDPCPTAAPRALVEEEKIYAAAFAAHFLGDNWVQPAVLSIKGVEPFEVYGYPGPVIWDRGTQASRLIKEFGGGVNVVSFHTADEKAVTGAPDIGFSADRKSARTTISCYSGRMSGEGVEVVLKKIGDEWFVVDMIGRYVS